MANFRNLIYITCLLFFVESSLELDAVVSSTKHIDTHDDVINAYSSVFYHQDKGCYCGVNYCTCCEDQIGDVCLTAGYYEIHDIPSAFGISVSNNGIPFINVTANATDLPCITLPYFKKSSAHVCLKVYGFEKFQKYVKVIFDIKLKYIFNSVDVSLGCLLIPRLHPENDFNQTVQYGTMLKQMDIIKAPEDNTGVKFCSSSSSTIVSSIIQIPIIMSWIYYRFHQ